MPSASDVYVPINPNQYVWSNDAWLKLLLELSLINVKVIGWEVKYDKFCGWSYNPGRAKIIIDVDLT